MISDDVTAFMYIPYDQLLFSNLVLITFRTPLSNDTFEAMKMFISSNKLAIFNIYIYILKKSALILISTFDRFLIVIDNPLNRLRHSHQRLVSEMSTCLIRGKGV